MSGIKRRPAAGTSNPNHPGRDNRTVEQNAKVGLPAHQSFVLDDGHKNRSMNSMTAQERGTSGAVVFTRRGLKDFQKAGLVRKERRMA